MSSYKDLTASGGLEAAILAPSLPSDKPQPAFLEALAWFAADTPGRAGQLTLETLDRVLESQARSYRGLLEGKVEQGKDTDYPRTRTWKIIQKLSLLKREMQSGGGFYAYRATPEAPMEADPWDREHTISSTSSFAEKVCRGSHEKPVLVKFGNTNCTQCMLFEMQGSVEAFAALPAHGSVEVYEVWWGFRPDASFAGRIKDPARLDDLVKSEGVKSSPTFVLYRNGRRYPCGSAFPDATGTDQTLEACLRQEPTATAQLSNACAATP